MSAGDADVGEGDGSVGEADGDGCGRGCRGGRETAPPLPGAVHVRRTSWDAEAEESKVRVALPAGVPRVTVTVSVALCPAASVPAVLLSLTWFGASRPRWPRSTRVRSRRWNASAWPNWPIPPYA